MSRAAHTTPTASPTRHRVVVVDDHPVVRAGFVATLAADPQLSVVGEAGQAREARHLVSQLSPDVVVIDLMLGGTGPNRVEDGLALLADLRSEQPALKLVVLSAMENPEFARRALASGATGYVSKSEPLANVVAAVHAALAGKTYRSPRVFFGAGQEFVFAGDATLAGDLTRLTNRELHVLRAIGLDHPNRRIAADLGLSVKTIESYKESLKEKLAAKDSVHLAEKARRFALALSG